MLKNLKFLARLMAFLRSIDPKTPLSHKLEPKLQASMEEEPFSKKRQELATEGKILNKAIFFCLQAIL